MGKIRDILASPVMMYYLEPVDPVHKASCVHAVVRYFLKQN